MSIDFASSEVQFFLYVGICAMLLFLAIAYESANGEEVDPGVVMMVLVWPITLPLGIVYFVLYAFFQIAKWFGRNYL
jgi:uncharacterized RDD family membrane protein YckC